MDFSDFVVRLERVLGDCFSDLVAGMEIIVGDGFFRFGGRAGGSSDLVLCPRSGEHFV